MMPQGHENSPLERPMWQGTETYCQQGSQIKKKRRPIKFEFQIHNAQVQYKYDSKYCM